MVAIKGGRMDFSNGNEKKWTDHVGDRFLRTSYRILRETIKEDSFRLVFFLQKAAVWGLHQI
jgi:hypothetical protein